MAPENMQKKRASKIGMQRGEKQKRTEKKGSSGKGAEKCKKEEEEEVQAMPCVEGGDDALEQKYQKYEESALHFFKNLGTFISTRGDAKRAVLAVIHRTFMLPLCTPAL